MAYRTVMLKGDGVAEEFLAVAALSPAHLLEVTSAGKVQKHSSAGGNSERIFAIENENEGQDIDTAYAADDVVRCQKCQSGDQVVGILTLSQTVAIGDPLESNGDGTLKKHAASSAGAVEYPEAIVGHATEAVTTTSAVANISVRIV